MISCTQEETAVCNFCTAIEISKSNLLWFCRFLGPLFEWPILHPAHLEEIYFPLPHQVCLLRAVVCSIPKWLVAVERETNNIRLKVGNNDVLAKINPNYLPSLIYLTAVLSNVPLNGH